jgi:divalent metal cation (Fe/Co/Zn/Cd) transporter
MRTQHFGPDELLVALKIQFDRDLSMQALAEGINEAERRIRAAVPSATMIFIEPDIYRRTASGGGAPEAAA